MTEVAVVVDGDVVPSRALDSVKLNLVDSLEEAFNFMRWASERRPMDVLGLDTETASLSPYRGKPLRLVQFGDGQQGWSIPWELWGGVALDLLNKWQGDWVLHNSRFDANWIKMATRRAGQPWEIDWSRTHDTLTQAHLDDPTRSRALKRLSGMLIDRRAETSQVVLEKEMNLNDWDWDTVPIVRQGAGSSYWIYAALDPVLTWRLHEHFSQTRIDYAAAYELEMGTVRCIADMEWRGARVDLPYCRSMLDKISDFSQRMRAWMKEAYGIGNAGSNQECIRKFEELGRTISVFTKSGGKSLDKEQLQTFLIERDANGDELPGNELAKALLDLRKQEKQAGPYFSNFERLADSDSVVHPTIWPCGTRTARMSITDPGLQTLPRGDPAVRDAFVPHDGNVLIAIDADQIELRLAAHFSQDAGLRAAFLEYPDVFNKIASDAWREEITKKNPKRQFMKNGVYGKLYGASVMKIAVTAGVPFVDMQNVMAQFDTTYPGIRILQGRVIAAGRERGSNGGRPYVNTPTGRRLYGDSGKEYALTNYLIQSHAAELLKRGICDISAAGYGEFMVLPVHDELLFDVPREELDEVLPALTGILDNVGKDYFVPITWGADVMENRWGDKYR